MRQKAKLSRKNYQLQSLMEKNAMREKISSCGILGYGIYKLTGGVRYSGCGCNAIKAIWASALGTAVTRHATLCRRKTTFWLEARRTLDERGQKSAGQMGLPLTPKKKSK